MLSLSFSDVPHLAPTANRSNRRPQRAERPHPPRVGARSRRAPAPSGATLTDCEPPPRRTPQPQAATRRAPSSPRAKAHRAERPRRQAQPTPTANHLKRKPQRSERPPPRAQAREAAERPRRQAQPTPRQSRGRFPPPVAASRAAFRRAASLHPTAPRRGAPSRAKRARSGSRASALVRPCGVDRCRRPCFRRRRRCQPCGSRTSRRRRRGWPRGE